MSESLDQRTSEALTLEFNPLNYQLCSAFPQRLAPSGWLALVPFGFFVIEAASPKTLVELGTHHGVSYCAFCQAVDALHLDTCCYAIDTWRGDPQAQRYDDRVLADLRSYHDPLYSKFSKLMQCTFDEGLSQFPDRSIDLLHIDGFHAYESVRHDFYSWLPKLSQRGMILLHDIHDQRPGFGVSQLWQEVKNQYPAFELLHSHGLGLLAVGSSYPDAFRYLFDAQVQDLDRIRAYYERLGALLDRIMEEQEVIASQSKKIKELEMFVERFRRTPLFKLYHWLKYFGR